ncbi:CHAT domain-containing protein [Nonomuraea sp. NPDC004580]|uniref:CHAT domain-containing protein n=1 Tax=Nonomuraea sp. NPDC004580 TaxID=3154552 RepID=UPI0033A056AE
MSGDIIVNVNPVGDGISACFVEAPFHLTNGGLTTLVRLNEVHAVTGPDAIQAVGRLLAAKIRENPVVDTVLTRIMTHPAAPPSIPIYFRVSDADAHGLSWEALVSDGNFIALDERWPILRIARGGNVTYGTERVFAPPLHLVCVLSAVGCPAVAEWQAIYSAVTQARTVRFPITVTLFAGEETEIINAVERLNDPGVAVRPVPANASDLLDALAALKPEPHLLHFYCHGTIAGDVRELAIGTISDFDNADGSFGPSSVKLKTQELGPVAKKAGTWAVILNTCRGAEAAGPPLTHAEEIVNGGVPIAIGMRRQVDAEDASAFSAAFYPAAFRAIHEAVGATDSATMSWGDTVLQARRKLRDRHGADPALHDAWTVPVLYTRPGPFTVLPATPAERDDTIQRLGTTRTTRGLLNVLPEGTPQDVLDELTAILSEGSA